jgi:transposase
VNYVGIDLHKKTIVTCVLNQDRKVIARRSFACSQAEEIRLFFTGLRPFRAVVEATASSHWLVELIEPLADRVVLAHPGKLRIIAESDKKTDRHDAHALAEFLALDKIPEAFRPGPRQRQHRALVRQRHDLQGRITSVKNKVRRVLADYNADRKDLFTAAGLAHLAAVALSEADRFVVEQLLAEWTQHRERLKEVSAQLKQFAAKAPVAEAEARAVLRTIPGVGPVTIDVVVSELGDVRRFGSAKKACAYAGLVPAVRQSAGKARELGITKRGSPLLRWALVEAAWRLVRHSGRWRNIYDNIKKRRGGKKGIVAVARRLLCVIVAMLRANRPYRLAAA